MNFLKEVFDAILVTRVVQQHQPSVTRSHVHRDQQLIELVHHLQKPENPDTITIEPQIVR